ncbi:MAG: filamentous hemagglutinin N-terminal domain-containing protein [Gammaproteobacteria bacterium]|nr:filamentous hemagglutinin N-terminal domain-containing protein [Gammaproteobacteria bacterium]
MIKIPIYIFFAASALLCRAEVVTDGTLGVAKALHGPRFAIEARLGSQMGGNLFHSFRVFNLSKDEAAVFTGPAAVDNIISRVTGGSASHVDGTLGVAIPGADVYFLNPAGVLFGPNARLNLPGSLYVSTADTLYLGETGRFDAARPQQSTLTTAPPTAFGFLTDTPAPISKDHGFLEVFENKILAFAGGDITLRDGQAKFNEDLQRSSFMRARGGQIHLVSVASKGKMPLDPEGAANAAFERLGTVVITDDTAGEENFSASRGIGNLDTSYRGGGKIYIRGGRIELDNAYLFADTLGEKDGQGITIDAAEELKFSGGARVTATAVYNPFFEKITGNAGDITIKAESVSIRGGSQISSGSQARTESAAGNISVSSEKSIEISGRSETLFRGEALASSLLSNTGGTGKGGRINLDTSTLTLADGGSVRAESQGAGDAGEISIQTGSLELTGGANMNVSTLAGQAGALRIAAQESVLIAGYADGEQGKDTRSGLFSNVFSTGQGGQVNISAPLLTLRNQGTIQSSTAGDGNAGEIVLETDVLDVDDGGFIATASGNASGVAGKGRAGDIRINAREVVKLAGSDRKQSGNVSTAAFGRGNAGNIFIAAPCLTLQHGGSIAAESKGPGLGGRIEIKTEHLNMQSAEVKTRADISGGGDIDIHANTRLHMVKSTISASAGGQQPQDKGGNLSIRQADFVILDKSRLLADAVAGNGGNIRMEARQFIRSNDSSLDASSELGVDGKIFISSPEKDASGELSVSPGVFLQVAPLQQICAKPSAGEKLSNFVMTGQTGTPNSPERLLVHIPSQQALQELIE